MADQKRWFKVWTSLLVDMDYLPAELVGHWVRLGCRIALTGNDGSVKFEGGFSHLAKFLNVTVEDAQCVLTALPGVSFEEGENRNGEIVVTMSKWRQYQIDTTAAQRQKALRSKRRGEEIRRDEIRKEEIKNAEPATPEPSAGVKKPESRKLELSPELRAAADAVYQTDRKKFDRLAVWLHQGQKNHFSDAVLAEALRRFLPYAAECRDWYPYLDKITYKADQDLNRDAHAAEHAKHKEEIRKTAAEVFDA